jgi:hypothetical protein
VQLRDELDEYGDIPQVANKDIDPMFWMVEYARDSVPNTRQNGSSIFGAAGNDTKKRSYESTLNHALMVSMNP